MPECRAIEWPYGANVPPILDTMRPGATEWYYQDHAALDCRGGGVTISNSTWVIDTADDDGDLTIQSQAINGLETQVRLAAAATIAEARVYHITNTVTMSDGGVVPARMAISVAPGGRVVD